MKLYKFLVPRVLGLSHKHQEFIEDAVKITGGLTIKRDNPVGYYRGEKGELIKDVHIEYLIAFWREDDVNKIAELVKKHFNQTAVFYYLISEEAYIHV